MATLTLTDGNQITYTALTIATDSALPNSQNIPHAVGTAATVIGSTGAAVNIGAATAPGWAAAYADPVTATIARVPLNRIRSAS